MAYTCCNIFLGVSLEKFPSVDLHNVVEGLIEEYSQIRFELDFKHLDHVGSSLAVTQ